MVHRGKLSVIKNNKYVIRLIIYYRFKYIYFVEYYEKNIQIIK